VRKYKAAKINKTMTANLNNFEKTIIDFYFFAGKGIKKIRFIPLTRPPLKTIS